VLFHAAGVPFEDVRVKSKELEALKHHAMGNASPLPFDQTPTVTSPEGVVIAQTAACMQFAGNSVLAVMSLPLHCTRCTVHCTFWISQQRTFHMPGFTVAHTHRALRCGSVTLYLNLFSTFVVFFSSSHNRSVCPRRPMVTHRLAKEQQMQEQCP
jgi:hypothetical protein